MREANKREKAVIVLAMHGAPPLDFPREELAEFFGLQARIEHEEPGRVPEALAVRYKELEEKIRRWPRTFENDPFFAGSLDLATELERASGLTVRLGFNEFCTPSMDDALAQAAGLAARKVIITTPMMTRGGEHSAVDIPRAIERARQKYPEVEFVYAWPFETREIARFLASQISRFV